VPTSLSRRAGIWPAGAPLPGAERGPGHLWGPVAGSRSEGRPAHAPALPPSSDDRGRATAPWEPG
jgi:hypothetical protein